MNLIERDICIIGAGPSGLSTALFLAKAGVSSTIIEKGTFPRDKICGDACSGKVTWLLNKLDQEWTKKIPHQSFQLPSWGVKFYGTKNNELKVPFQLDYDTKNTAPGFIASRLDFDNFLYKKAKENERIEIIEKITLTNFRRENEVIISSTAKEDFTIKSKMVIAADGAYSKIAKDLMNFTISDKHNCLGLRTYYEGVADLDQDGFIELHFLDELLPGYFWIFPMENGKANVGAGIRTDLMRNKKMNLKKVFQEIIEKHPIIAPRFKNAKLIDKIKLHGLPTGGQKRAISTDNLILTGDAAALIDPFTGEGIGNALISGMLAAEKTVECFEKNDFSAQEIQSYDAKIYRRFGSELQLSKKMQELTKYPWLFNLVVNKASRSKELRDTISCMFENVDIRKKLSNPLFYLRILFS